MTLNSLYPDWLDPLYGGVFADLAASYETEFEWLENAGVLDEEYYGNHSGQKEASPLLNVLYSEEEEELTSYQRGRIAYMIANKFRNKWTRLWALHNIEYEPIENYAMVQVETPNISQKHKASDDFARVTQTSSDASQDVYGFNSNSAIPQGESETSATGRETQTGYTEDTETGTRQLTRSGNIGVTTSQQMAQSEIELWQWNFFEEVFKDVDTVLTLAVY